MVKYTNNLTFKVLFRLTNAIEWMEYGQDPNISTLLHCIGEDDGCQLN